VIQTVDPRGIGYSHRARGRPPQHGGPYRSVGGFCNYREAGLRVAKDQSLATIHARSREDLTLGRSILEGAIVIGDFRDPTPPASLTLGHRPWSGSDRLNYRATSVARVKFQPAENQAADDEAGEHPQSKLVLSPENIA
jgi:hypothetical protein